MFDVTVLSSILTNVILTCRYDNLDDALGSIKPVYRKLPTVSNNSANDGETVTVTTPMGALEDDDLWCTHCMDDPAVAVCAFCGCRVRTSLYFIISFLYTHILICICIYIFYIFIRHSNFHMFFFHMFSFSNFNFFISKD